MVMGLPDIEQVLRVHEQADLAKDEFAHGTKLDISSAADKIGIVVQRLATGIIGFDTHAAAPMHGKSGRQYSR